MGVDRVCNENACAQKTEEKRQRFKHRKCPPTRRDKLTLCAAAQSKKKANPTEHRFDGATIKQHCREIVRI